VADPVVIFPSLPEFASFVVTTRDIVIVEGCSSSLLFFAFQHGTPIGTRSRLMIVEFYR
jgi:hypothetical protein